MKIGGWMKFAYESRRKRKVIESIVWIGRHRTRRDWARSGVPFAYMFYYVQPKKGSRPGLLPSIVVRGTDSGETTTTYGPAYVPRDVRQFYLRARFDFLFFFIHASFSRSRLCALCNPRDYPRFARLPQRVRTVQRLSHSEVCASHEEN